MPAPFPAIRPTSRSYRPGKFPQVEFQAQNGATTVIRFGQKPFNSELELAFANITDAEAAQIVDHYEERMALFSNVTFSASNVLSGLGSALSDQVIELDTGLVWRYAEPPQVESVYPGVSTVTCKFTGYLDGA